MKLFNKNGKFKKNITNEINEKDLENVIGGVEYEYAKQQLEDLKDKDELFENDLEKVKAGIPLTEDDIIEMNR